MKTVASDELTCYKQLATTVIQSKQYMLCYFKNCDL